MLRGGAGKMLLYRWEVEPLGWARKSRGAETLLETMNMILILRHSKLYQKTKNLPYYYVYRRMRL